MTYWLKLIGEDGNRVDSWEQPYVDFSGATGQPLVQQGDFLVLYATGHRRLFAIAQATSDVYSTSSIPDAWGEYRIDVNYVTNRSVANGPHGDEFDPPFRAFGGGHYRITLQRFEAALAVLGE